jgi:hypothetical protein
LSLQIAVAAVAAAEGKQLSPQPSCQAQTLEYLDVHHQEQLLAKKLHAAFGGLHLKARVFGLTEASDLEQHRPKLGQLRHLEKRISNAPLRQIRGKGAFDSPWLSSSVSNAAAVSMTGAV